MKDAEPKIDPRYNPAFQPGYDHAIHAVPASPARLRPVEAVRKVLSREPQTSTPTARLAPLAAPQSTELPQLDEVPDVATTDTADALARPFLVVSGNPFLRALWLVGPVLTAFGLWAQWQSVSAFSGFNGGPTRPEDFLLPQFLGGIGPWCTVLGVATLVTVLVLHAVHWRSPE
ncbi:hypothetical protein [Salinibacterium sp. ZJ450]|uniref:hypothetical protein n=1 Tax=Salinibacterium sp. ZJ450 TaxID=2708338 RepID=UPI001422DBFE|nr:hypothetical protein [Salinibacterium sp. ZJ450]